MTKLELEAEDGHVAAGITCPKCGHVRSTNTGVPDWQCPACGVVYSKVQDKLANDAGALSDRPTHHSVNVLEFGEHWKAVVLIALLVFGGYWSWDRDEIGALSIDAGSYARDHATAPIVQYESTAVGREFKKLRVPGQVTIVEFYADWCPACKQMPANYRRLLSVRPDVVVRRVRLPAENSTSTGSRIHGIRIRSVPHMIIYDAAGKLVKQDDGQSKAAHRFFFDWTNLELKNAWRRSRG